VAIDNYKAAYDVTKELMANGKKRIAMVAYCSELQHMRERVQGYKDALGAEFRDELLQRVEYSELVDNVPTALDALTQGDPMVDAIFFATNTLGVNGLKHMDRLRLHVPQQIAVIVFDESEVYHFFYCPLTHVKQPLAEMATKAVEVLLNQIKDPKAKREKIKLDVQLIIGDSSK